VIYAGVVHPGEFAPFVDISSTSHIDAIKRQDVLQECIDDAVTKTTAMINALVWKKIGEKKTVSTEEEDANTPSIYDVFTVPSLKAREIDGQSDSAAKKSK
jgi:hypothetical protein